MLFQGGKNTPPREVGDGVERAVEESHWGRHKVDHYDLLNRRLSICRDHEERGRSGALAGGAQPLYAAELQIAHVAFRQRTIRLIQATSQSSTANPISGLVLLENGGIEGIHAM